MDLGSIFLSPLALRIESFRILHMDSMRVHRYSDNYTLLIPESNFKPLAILTIVMSRFCHTLLP